MWGESFQSGVGHLGDGRGLFPLGPCDEVPPGSPVGGGRWTGFLASMGTLCLEAGSEHPAPSARSNQVRGPGICRCHYDRKVSLL